MFIKNQGFTLIEVIIYIALFTLLMGVAFVTAYGLIDSTSNLNNKNTVQEEGNFILRKLNWALTGASSFSNTADTLHIEKFGGNMIDIELVDTKIMMTESITSGAHPLTTDNVSVDSLEFSAIAGTPQGVTITIVMNGSNFTITKYLRQ